MKKGRIITFFLLLFFASSVAFIAFSVKGSLINKTGMLQTKLNALSKYKVNAKIIRENVNDINISFIFEDEINTFPNGTYDLKFAPNTKDVISNLDEFLIGSADNYIKSSSKLEIKITGVADGSPPKKDSKYWGAAINETYLDSLNNMQTIILKNGTGFYQNNIAYAFLRAYSFREEIKAESELLKNAEFTIVARETQEKGSEYRKAGIYISLLNAIDWSVFSTGDISIDNFKAGLKSNNN